MWGSIFELFACVRHRRDHILSHCGAFFSWVSLIFVPTSKSHSRFQQNDIISCLAIVESLSGCLIMQAYVFWRYLMRICNRLSLVICSRLFDSKIFAIEFLAGSLIESGIWKKPSEHSSETRLISYLFFFFSAEISSMWNSSFFASCKTHTKVHNISWSSAMRTQSNMMHCCACFCSSLQKNRWPNFLEHEDTFRHMFHSSDPCTWRIKLQGNAGWSILLNDR